MSAVIDYRSLADVRFERITDESTEDQLRESLNYFQQCRTRFILDCLFLFPRCLFYSFGSILSELGDTYRLGDRRFGARELSSARKTFVAPGISHSTAIDGKYTGGMSNNALIE